MRSRKCVCKFGYPGIQQKNHMKKAACVLLSLIGVLGTVLGQNPLTPASPFLPANPQRWKLSLQPPGVVSFDGSPAPDPMPNRLPAPLPALVSPHSSVRNLEPDRMPCLFPDLAKVEKMPGVHLGNRDSMPNALSRRRHQQ